MGLWVMVLVLMIPMMACATIAPPKPRFVAVHEQRTDFCRIQVVQDTRTGACFVVFRCGRQPVQVIAVGDEVCVP